MKVKAMISGGLLVVTALVCPHAQAQYKGGHADGSHSRAMQSANPLNNIYKGSSGNGFASVRKANSNTLPNIYFGATGDGAAYAHSVLANYQANIYAGGDGDGHGHLRMHQQNQMPNIYGGGRADGYAMVHMFNKNSAENIYSGGNSDGFSSRLSVAQNGLNNIYSGGDNDGFSGIAVYQLNPLNLRTGFAIAGNWQQEKILVSWQINDQQTNGYYEVERSAGDADHFVKIAGVNAARASKGATENTFVDDDTRNYSVFYYRLKRVGEKDEHQYSALVRLNKQEKNVSYTIYPNPGKGLFNISINGVIRPDGYTYQVVNAARAIITKGSVISALTQFDISRMPAGIYHVQLYHNTHIKSSYNTKT